MLSVEERVYTLSYLWKEAEYNYAFWALHPEIDWDKEYRTYLPQVINAADDFAFLCLLKRFYATLQDGHTAVTFPPAVWETFSFPVSFDYVGSEIVLTGVPEGCEEHLFARLLAVNGMPFETFLTENVYPYFGHQKLDNLLRGGVNFRAAILMTFYKEETVTLTTAAGTLSVSLHDERGETQKQVALHPSEPLRDYRSFASCRICLTDDDIACITISDFYHDELVQDILSIKDRLAACRAILLDVRGNGGGKGAPPFHVAQLFFGGTYPINTHLRTPSHNARLHALEPYIDHALIDTDEQQKQMYQVATHTYYAQEGDAGMVDFNWFDTLFQQPVVLLTDCGTACAAEGFVDYFRMAKRGRTVGSPTCGSGSEAMIRDLPLGAKMWLGTTWQDLCSGEPYINIGILPDVEKRLSLDDWKAGRDTVLDEGLRVLRDRLT